MRFKIASLIERAFRAIGDAAYRMAERVALCPDCGRNRYDGRPCKNVEV